MKANYFTKVENKYVFNLSLIFWHLFIVLSSLAIVAFLAIFLWTITPTSQKKVEKQPYPEKKQYPEPVKVLLSELKLEDIKQEEIPEQVQVPEVKVQQVTEDVNGKSDYELSVAKLKRLIPPSKYSWSGSGYWTYPNGERYWLYFKQEKYRHWIIDEPSVEEKLKFSFNEANAKSYPEKKEILDGYISVVELLPEEKRLSSLQYLINNVANNISQSKAICNSIAKVIPKMGNSGSIEYINKLAEFGKKNQIDGSLFIEYVSTIISKFNALQQDKIVSGLTISYYNYFNNNLNKQKEATDLFIPMLKQIKGENHPKALMQYYGLYLSKNFDRDNSIAQIENDYQLKISEIENQYNMEEAAAMIKYQQKKLDKQTYRLKALMGIGGGVFLIALIATMLVFLSIQRSVRKIEEKLPVKSDISSNNRD